MKERGVALLMGLVLLAAVSLLALMAANGMVLQRQMSANFGERARALAQATRATAAATDWLYSRAGFERESSCVTDCFLPVGVHRSGQLPRNPEFESANWWRSSAVAAGTHPETGEPLDVEASENDPPRWLIEELHFAIHEQPGSGPAVSGVGYYRILARGGSDRSGSVAVTESIVAKPWGGEFEPLPYPTEGLTSQFCRQFGPTIDCGTQAWRQRR